MNYQCDTRSDCPHEGCPHYGHHSETGHCSTLLHCRSAGHRVRCNPNPREKPQDRREVPACTLTGEWTPRKRQVTVRCSQLSEAEICLLNGIPCSVATDGITCAPTCCTMEAHTCYFCDHTGQDVNRIAVVMPPKEYCCDDGEACDERWQQLGDAGTTAQREERLAQLAHLVKPWLGHEQPSLADDDLKAKVREAIYKEVSQPGSVTGITARATANVLRIIELPF